MGEFNTDDTHPLRFIQMWMVPRSRNLEPNYGSMVGDRERQHNKWAHLVADVKNTSADTPVKINQDANIWVTELDEGKEGTFVLREGRQAYILPRGCDNPHGSVGSLWHQRPGK